MFSVNTIVKVCVNIYATKGYIVVTRGEKIYGFIEAYCKIPEGTKVGLPIKLMKLQKQFITDVYNNPHGNGNAYLSVARRNGKSALFAAVVLVHVVGPEAT